MVNRLLDARAEDAIYNRILLQRWIDLYFIAGKQQSQQEKCQQARQQVVAAMGPSVRNALLWTAAEIQKKLSRPWNRATGGRRRAPLFQPKTTWRIW